jgi:hypothetical protein
MKTSQKVRAYLIKNPSALIKDVAAKFNCSLPMVYNIRSAIRKASAPAPMFVDLRPEDLNSEQAAPADEASPKKIDIDATINERGTSYGKFKDGAALMQSIKRLITDHATKHNKTFTDAQWEALEMIVHKIGRIVNGNPDLIDHWLDIAGYAVLVADGLEANND